MGFDLVVFAAMYVAKEHILHNKVLVVEQDMVFCAFFFLFLFPTISTNQKDGSWLRLPSIFGYMAWSLSSCINNIEYVCRRYLASVCLWSNSEEVL